MSEKETKEELLKRKVAEFAQFYAERVPVLEEFAEDIELPHAAMIVTNPAACLDGIEAFMEDQVVDEDDWVWILTRIGYFIGELLAKRLSGRWLVNRVYGTPTFGRYVIGEFSGISNSAAMVDPFEVAVDYLQTPPPRELRGLVEEVVTELRTA